MSKSDKTLEKILGGQSDANIRFDDALSLLPRLGFHMRIRGSHHIFTRPGIEVLIDLQPVQGKCKPYQIRQIREIIRRFNIAL